MVFVRYKEIEPVRRLKESGRELLGREVFITVKRDGSNIGTQYDPVTKTYEISSHNMEDADPKLKEKLMSTKEWPKLQKLMLEEFEGWGHIYRVFGELIPAGYGPTRIEPKHRITSYEMFDIVDTATGLFLPYTLLYQTGYHYKIPVVKLVEQLVPKSMEELNAKTEEMKKWARRHRREGVVGKAPDPHPKWGQTYFKEKIDLPELPKLERQPKVTLPEMPQERIIRALQHAFDIVGEANWSDRSKSMPEIAKQLQVEAAEHNFGQPRNFYQIYLDTSIEKLRERVSPTPPSSEVNDTL